MITPAELDNSRLYPSDQEMFPGTTFLYTCTSDTPVKWIVSGGASFADNVQQVGESVLYLTDIDTHNEGVYECRGTYDDGEAEMPFAARARLTVYCKLGV